MRDRERRTSASCRLRSVMSVPADQPHRAALDLRQRRARPGDVDLARRRAASSGPRDSVGRAGADRREDAVARVRPLAVRDVPLPEQDAARLVRAVAERPLERLVGGERADAALGVDQADEARREVRDRVQELALTLELRDPRLEGSRSPTALVRGTGIYAVRRSGNRGSPSSGIGSHAAAYATNCRNCGRTPGSPSNVPSRTLMISPSGSRLQSAPPHAAQKHFGQPSCGAHSPHELLARRGAATAAADAHLRRRRRARSAAGTACSGSTTRARRAAVDLEAHAAAVAAAGTSVGHESEPSRDVGTLRRCLRRATTNTSFGVTAR